MGNEYCSLHSEMHGDCLKDSTEDDTLINLLSAVKEFIQVDDESLESVDDFESLRIRWAAAVDKVLIAGKVYNKMD